jgi:hypothetical protein
MSGLPIAQVAQMDLKVLELPHQQRHLMVSPLAVMVRRVHDLVDYLIPVLDEGAWHRLRICECGRLFVALNVRALYCSPECSNRQRQKSFYNANVLEQRRIKLARYHENRIRRVVAQQRPSRSSHRPFRVQ